MFDVIKPETDPIATILAAVDGLAAEGRDHWAASALSERLVVMLEARERFDAEITRLAGSWDRHQAWAVDGALSGPSWLTRRAPISRTKARLLVSTGRMTVDHQVVEDALSAGDVTVDHVEVLVRIGGKHRKDLFGDDVDLLVGHASGLRVDEFSTAANLWAKLADDEMANRSFMEQYEQRGLYLSPILGGVVRVDGMLDPDAGATVITALEHLVPPDPADTPDGPRSLAQRRADGLVELAETYLSGSDRKAASVTVNAVIDVATLSGDPCSGGTDGPASKRCDVDRVGAVGRVTMERLGCGAEFTRVVMDGPSVVLDLGRSRRLASPGQRQALTVRDRGCVFEGCGRPARWCDIHHLTSWLHGGLTNIEDLVLVCRRHHVLCHEGGWRLKREPNGTITTIPPARARPNARPP